MVPALLSSWGHSSLCTIRSESISLVPSCFWATLCLSIAVLTGKVGSNSPASPCEDFPTTAGPSPRLPSVRYLPSCWPLAASSSDGTSHPSGDVCRGACRSSAQKEPNHTSPSPESCNKQVPGLWGAGTWQSSVTPHQGVKPSCETITTVLFLWGTPKRTQRVCQGSGTKC